LECAWCVSVLTICRRQPKDGKPAAAAVRPEFKNPKVASLYDVWQRVLQLSAERRQRLQQTLDQLNEVRYQRRVDLVFTSGPTHCLVPSLIA